MASLAQLQVLRRQYFSLYPPHIIQLNLEPRLALARNQAWIYDHLLSAESLAGNYPPANDYQRKFWKLLVAVLEDELRDDEAVEEELELDDRIAEHYTALIAQSTNPFNVPGPSYKTYVYDTPNSDSTADVEPSVNPNLSEKAITLLEAQTTIEAGSTGLRTWTASLHLATLLSTDPSLLDPPFPHPPPEPSSSSRVYRTNFLELGAGTGFLSCYLAQTAGRTIWATDIGDEGDNCNDEEDEQADVGQVEDGVVTQERTEGLRRGPLRSLKSNLKTNRPRFHPDSRVIPRSLDWFDALPPDNDRAASEAHEAVRAFSNSLPEDLILLAADVIYDPDLVAPLVAMMKLLLTETTSSPSSTGRAASSSTRFALLAATVRNQKTTDLFERECERIGLKISIVPSDRRTTQPVTPMFWNASTWEGQDVRVIRIWL